MEGCGAGGLAALEGMTFLRWLFAFPAALRGARSRAGPVSSRSRKAGSLLQGAWHTSPTTIPTAPSPAALPSARGDG